MNKELLDKLRPNLVFFQTAYPSRFGVEPPAIGEGDLNVLKSQDRDWVLKTRKSTPAELAASVEIRICRGLKDWFYLANVIRYYKAQYNAGCVCEQGAFDKRIKELNQMLCVNGEVLYMQKESLTQWIWDAINLYNKEKGYLKALAKMRLETLYYVYYRGQNSGEFNFGSWNNPANALSSWLYNDWTRPDAGLIAALNAAENLLLKSFEPLVASIAPADDYIPQSKKRGQ